MKSNIILASLDNEDHIHRVQKRLESLLLQGLESGEPIEMTEEYIQYKRAELLAKCFPSTEVHST